LSNNQSTIQIGNSVVGVGGQVFVIAEAGVNHNGDVEIAKRMIEVAKNAGADAIKFQTFKAESIATADAPKAYYQRSTTESGESQLEMLRKLELSESAHYTLKEHCDKVGITLLSTPFDETSADLLERLSVPAYKLSSGDLTNWPLIEHVARKGKPLIISTGMATIDEVADAVFTATGAGCKELVVLHCVSNYPATAAEVNLRAMATMQKQFAIPVGYSDHTVGIAVCLAAVALGAAVIEKHFTLDRNLPGPDHPASLEPFELESLVRGIREVEVSLGSSNKKPSAEELETAKVARRSIVAAINIQCGSVLERESLILKRPGTGLPPSMLKTLVGKRARTDIPAGMLITLEMLV
jgi:N,N'-diacetyllegionaminate synthase